MMIDFSKIYYCDGPSAADAAPVVHRADLRYTAHAPLASPQRFKPSAWDDRTRRLYDGFTQLPANRAGRAMREGNVEIPPMQPYPISYRAIVPKEEECTNLLVPICLSASHIAYGSIRMEPVFMILGQSAAAAAALALETDGSVQQVEYSRLRQQLLRDNQILEWS